ncbi:ca2+ activated outward rectifying K+ channel 5 [Artemisia annua]|uniref:Ca2+ activated outward rectifying K+ channel 5 n=1 Tax=Artemisia annua TaxID=35608 RepID=A0A2U1PGX2_ARTAN|nr:ca2+ activated outward rectifying K+ channel 5 [Artemisia annua]
MKVCLALGVVMLSIGIGVFVLYYVEGLGWVDSFYLSVLSVTTVGYGDKAFETLEGRLFASFWLLFSTLMVARAFLYLAEARIDKRHRRVANWVLQREITVKDMLDADMNNNGFLRDWEAKKKLCGLGLGLIPGLTRLTRYIGQMGRPIIIQRFRFWSYGLKNVPCRI